MVTSLDETISETVLETDKVAMTQEYLEDAMKELRNAGEVIDFQDLYDQATMLHHLIEGNIEDPFEEDTDHQYVISGTAENPVYTRVDPYEEQEDDIDIIQEVWQDEEGEYNNFPQAYLDGATPEATEVPTRAPTSTGA